MEEQPDSSQKVKVLNHVTLSTASFEEMGEQPDSSQKVKVLNHVTLSWGDLLRWKGC